jgi:hypothetical protein
MDEQRETTPIIHKSITPIIHPSMPGGFRPLQNCPAMTK